MKTFLLDLSWGKELQSEQSEDCAKTTQMARSPAYNFTHHPHATLKLGLIICAFTIVHSASIYEPTIEQKNQCSALVDHRLINLAPLAQRGFTPRFQTRYKGWTYSYNLCLPFNIPENPRRAFGDGCEYVSFCKSKRKRGGLEEAYTLGILHLVTFVLKTPVISKRDKSVSFTVAPKVSQPQDILSTTSSTSVDIRGTFQPVDGLRYTKALDWHSNVDDGQIKEIGNVELEEILIDDQRGEVAEGKDSKRTYDGIKDEDASGENEGAINDDEEEIDGPINTMSLKDTSERDGYGNMKVTSREGTQSGGWMVDDEVESVEEDEEDADEDGVNEKDSEEDMDEEDEKEEEEEEMEDNRDIDKLTKNKQRDTDRRRMVRELSDKRRRKYKDNLKSQVPTIKMTGIMSYSNHTTYIYLICDGSLKYLDSGKFKVLDSDEYMTHIELRHLCCCPDSCIQIQGLNSSDTVLTAAVHDGKGDKGVPFWPPPEILWVVVTVFLILLASIVIGTTCCRTGGSRGPYTTLPGIHASRLTLESQESFRMGNLKFPSPDYLDYDAPKLKTSLPSIENGLIKLQDINLRQRLGGGLFGDTYLGEMGDRTVSAKRLTVGVHQGQLTEMDLARLQDAVSMLSRFRHRNVVSVWGICFELRQPHVIKEFVDGESLRDLLQNVTDGSLTYYRKLKMLTQAAEGMVYLHSAKYPVLHRDLRCANLLVSKVDDRVQITDFGMVAMLHKLRVQCTGRKGCYCQKETPAWPASIRWTAPEVLTHPTSEESESDIFGPPCDVFSFAMTMWEAMSVSDPWCEMQDERQVTQKVLSGSRLDVKQLQNVPPVFITLMQASWLENPDKRPQFKQIVGHLNACAKQMSKDDRKRRDSNSSTMTYFRSALNIAVE